MVLRSRPSLSLLPDLALCPLPLLLALGGWQGGLLAAPLALGESWIIWGSERVLEVLTPSLPHPDTQQLSWDFKSWAESSCSNVFSGCGFLKSQALD